MQSTFFFELCEASCRLGFSLAVDLGGLDPLTFRPFAVGAMSCCCCSCIETGHVGVVQKWAKFEGIQEPGCMCICCPITSVQAVSLAVKQLQCHSDCKTKDNVTVTVVTAVQYRILKEQVKIATFDIKNAQAQMSAEVDSILRSTLPTLTLDESYEAKEKMVEDILSSVRDAMGKYGYLALRCFSIFVCFWRVAGEDFLLGF